MKSALVTGASSGIGYAVAQRLHQAGWQIEGIARDFSSMDTSFMRTHSVDLSQLDALPGMLEKLEIPAPDCLVLAAGAGVFGGVEQLSYAQIQSNIALNLTSNLFLIKHFLPLFKKLGGRDIVLIGSEASLRGAKQGAVYCAGKFGLRGFAQSLRADCANKDIRVILVNPGPTASAFHDDLHFEPMPGDDFLLSAKTVAETVCGAIDLPRNTVQEEINVQPIKRAFRSKKPL